MDTLTTPVRIGELAAALKLGKSTIYRHVVELGYVFKYPLIRKTTIEHYLAWLELQPASKSKNAQRMEEELERLRQPSRKNKEGRKLAKDSTPERLPRPSTR